MTQAEPGEHPLVLNLRNKLSELSNVDKAKQAELVKKANEIIGAQVYPAYQSLKATLESLLPKILNTLPKAGVEVKRIAEHEQDSAIIRFLLWMAVARVFTGLI